MSKELSELEFLKYKIKVLNKIGLAFSTEKDIDRLFEMILQETINLTGADAGSIYMVDHIDGIDVMVFKNFINQSSKSDFKGESLRIDESSLTGYVALHGEAIVINDLDEEGESYPFKINKSYDKRLRYKTQNVLTVPMRNNANEVLGVLQILNKKDQTDLELL
ncbi:MAG: GAF domain-containing protein, partial [Firmicutes bacterium]|nr:GAF domain-containing protein [Bacillota bacterium]